MRKKQTFDCFGTNSVLFHLIAYKLGAYSDARINHEITVSASNRVGIAIVGMCNRAAGMSAGNEVDTAGNLHLSVSALVVEVAVRGSLVFAKQPAKFD